MTVQDEQGLAAIDTPEPDGAVAAPRDQPAAVGAERDAMNTTDVAAEGVERLASRGVPHAGSSDRPRTTPVAARRAVGHAADAAGWPARAVTRRPRVGVEDVAPGDPRWAAAIRVPSGLKSSPRSLAQMSAAGSRSSPGGRVEDLDQRAWL